MSEIDDLEELCEDWRLAAKPGEGERRRNISYKTDGLRKRKSFRRRSRKPVTVVLLKAASPS